MSYIPMYLSIYLFNLQHQVVDLVSRVTVTTLFSFIAAALAASRRFCYSAVASSSVVLILPVSYICHLIRAVNADFLSGFYCSQWRSRVNVAQHRRWFCASLLRHSIRSFPWVWVGDGCKGIRADHGTGDSWFN